METIKAELPSGKSRARFIVGTPSGSASLFTVRDRKHEGLVIMPSHMEMVRPPWYTGDHQAKEFRFSLHTSRTGDTFIFTHTTQLANGDLLDSRATIKSDGGNLCWPVYSERYKLLDADRYGRPPKSNEHAIELADYDPNFHTLVYTLVAVTKGFAEPLPKIKYHSALRVEFTEFDLVIYWTFLNSPTTIEGTHLIMSDVSFRTNKLYVQDQTKIAPIEYESLDPAAEDGLSATIGWQTAALVSAHIDCLERRLLPLGTWPYDKPFKELAEGAQWLSACAPSNPKVAK